MFAAGEECRYGDHCNFAHGRHELRKPTFYKKHESPAEDDNQVTVLLLISMMSLLFAIYALNLLILSISSVFLLGIPCLCATLLTIRSIEHEHIITYYKLLCAYGYELQTLSFWGSPHHHFVFVDTLCLTGFF